MFNLFGKLAKWVVGIVIFLAALATIAGYLETSTKWPKVANMLDSIVSSELLTLVYRLLFLLAAAISVWWFNRRLDAVENAIEKHLRKLEGVKDSYVSLQVGEIIHPSPDGVLWRWNADRGVDGPFCPRHRDRLFHKNWLGQIRTENFDDGFLNETFWLTCPADQEDFKLSVPHSTKIGDLRIQANARLEAK